MKYIIALASLALHTSSVFGEVSYAESTLTATDLARMLGFSVFQKYEMRNLPDSYIARLNVTREKEGQQEEQMSSEVLKESNTTKNAFVIVTVSEGLLKIWIAGALRAFPRDVFGLDPGALYISSPQPEMKERGLLLFTSQNTQGDKMRFYLTTDARVQPGAAANP